MKDVNVIAATRDGRAITTRRKSFAEAAKEVLRWLEDEFYSTCSNPIERVFMSNGECLMEYTPRELEELAGGLK
jgi:hypothetical protein